MIKTLGTYVVAGLITLAVWELFVKKLVVKTAYEANFEG